MVFQSLLYSQDTNKNVLKITKQPISITTCNGQSAKFEVEIDNQTQENNASEPVFQWQVSIDAISWNDVSDTNNATYVLTENAHAAHNGSFVRVKIKSNEQELVSESATLFVESGLFFTKQPENVEVVMGGMAVFNSEADLVSKNGTPIYQWQFCELGTTIWQDWRGQTLPQLIVNPDGGYKGLYVRLSARPRGGCEPYFSNKALLSVITTPVVNVIPASKTFCGGGDATFSVRLAGGSGKEKLQWQVSKNNGKSFENIKKATDFQYRLQKINPEMSGWQYRTAVSVPGEKIVYTEPSIITVHGEVVVEKQPQSQINCFGDVAIFEIKASFNGQTPEYQWASSTDGENFIDISNENAPKLFVTGDSSKILDSYYRVTLSSGECQNIISEKAKYSLIKDVVFTQNPIDLIVLATNNTASFTADYIGDEKNCSESWQMSYNEGATWVPVAKSNGKILQLTNLAKFQNGMYFRMKVMNKACGKIVFSESAKLILN
jgi:large repetitive protein